MMLGNKEMPEFMCEGESGSGAVDRTTTVGIAEDVESSLAEMEQTIEVISVIIVRNGYAMLVGDHLGFGSEIGTQI